MSMESLRANDSFLDPRIHRLKNHPGQAAAVKNIKRLIKGSRLINSLPGKVQDAYCLRCIPQVHGATRDLYDYIRKTVATEMNAVTDNPLIMEDGCTVSGGNFHGQQLAFAMDTLAIAVAEMADISERRISRLLDGKLNDGLPEFLMKKNGVNSGFMIAQYTAASLVAENKILCHPASVDSIPTSANQEDHVSLGSIAARKIHEVCFNTEQVLLLEFLCAAQALDFVGSEKAGREVSKIHQTIREAVSHADKDRVWADDILKICGLVKADKI
jgi:histidine ammonia-lyase